MKKFGILLSVLMVMVVSISMSGCNNCAHINKTLIENTATCENNGIATYRCDDCGKTIEEESVALGHDYSVFVKDSATCTASGYITNKCSRCDSPKDTYSAAKGHHYTGIKCDNCYSIKEEYEKENIRYSSSNKYNYSKQVQYLINWTVYELHFSFAVEAEKSIGEFTVMGNLKKFALEMFRVSIYDSNNIELGSGGIMVSPNYSSMLVSRDITLTRPIEANEVCYIAITTSIE